jgi:uncharacterized protein DUF3182
MQGRSRHHGPVAQGQDATAGSGGVPRGVVQTWGAALPGGGHERATHGAIARGLAALLGYAFADEAATGAPSPAPRYLVPSDTLLHDTARAFGVHGRGDLFGGVVPHAFVGTKSITHALVPGATAKPDGWTPAFASRVDDDVLAGYAAFARADVAAAVQRLLARGAVRIKRATGIGGTGQWLVHDGAQAGAAIATLDEAELAHVGCVVEEHLAEVSTASVGRVEVGDMVVTYCGRQRLTVNGAGHEVYGGSDLLVARGDFDALLRLPLEAPLRLAIGQARAYDAAADACFPGFFASRRNYDVAQGLDTGGRARSGVLEQSWRIGGASGAEVAALRAFAADPELVAVWARTAEVYGAAEPPPDAQVLYRGADPRTGALLKYATVEPYAHP